MMLTAFYFQAKVRKICLFYDELHPILRDRPSVKAPFVSDSSKTLNAADIMFPKRSDVTLDDLPTFDDAGGGLLDDDVSLS